MSSYPFIKITSKKILTTPPIILIYMAHEVFWKPRNTPKNNAINKLIGSPKALILK